MGQGVLSFWKNKVSKESKIALFASLIFVFAVHMFMFTNVMPNHDSLFHFYTEYDMIISGRWFLTYACGVSSYFDIPWLIGVLSAIYISLTAMIVVDIFKIKNQIVIILVSGIISTYPAICKTFQFFFTADGYMMAMLLAALTVWLSIFERRKIVYFVAAIMTICLSCAIYQAYVSFALLLMLCYFIYELLENRRTTKEIWRYFFKQIGIYSCGMILYYAVWKIILVVKSVQATDYQGISDVSDLGSFLDVSIPFRLFDGTIKSLNMYKKVFFEKNLNEGISLYAALNMIFLAVAVFVIVLAFKKSGLYKNKLHCFFAICAILLWIPCAHIWFYASLSVWYHLIMEQAICVLYIFVVIFCERWIKIKLKNVFALLFALIILNNAVLSNISYIYMHKAYEYSYANGLDMVLRIRNIEEEYSKIAVVGSVTDSMVRDMNSYAKKSAYLVSTYQYTNLLYDQAHVRAFLENTFYSDYTFVDDSDLVEIYEKDEVVSMTAWPDKGSVKVVDGILVIKLE